MEEEEEEEEEVLDVPADCLWEHAGGSHEPAEAPLPTRSLTLNPEEAAEDVGACLSKWHPLGGSLRSAPQLRGRVAARFREPAEAPTPRARSPAEPRPAEPPGALRYEVVEDPPDRPTAGGQGRCAKVAEAPGKGPPGLSQVGHCDHCGARGPLRRCGRCRDARYCSPRCQQAAWAGGHRRVCGGGGGARRSPCEIPAGPADGRPRAAAAGASEGCEPEARGKQTSTKTRMIRCWPLLRPASLEASA